MMKNLTKYFIVSIRLLSIVIGIVNIQKNKVIILSAIIFTVCSFSLTHINKIKNLISNYTNLLIINIFIFSAIFLGGGLNLYQKLYWWDILIHTFSGIIFTIIGINLSKRLKIQSKYKVFFSLLIVMSSTLTWEILEFIVDSFFKTNLQEWNNMAKELFANNIKRRGHGLVDSMLDMIYAIFGFLIIIKVLE